MDIHRTKREMRRRRPAKVKHTFTVEHANRTLPLVRRIVGDLVKAYAHVTALETQAEEAILAGRAEQARAIRTQRNQGLDDLRGLAEELADIGCVPKDAQRGLVDFPAVCDGRPVYLCWRLGEDQVEHWHELEAGFADRQTIGKEFAT